MKIQEVEPKAPALLQCHCSYPEWNPRLLFKYTILKNVRKEA
jgi:hypothetical protein